MKRVKQLTVKVTYRVALLELDIPINEYHEMAQSFDEGEEIEVHGMKYELAQEWLVDNIKESDCMDWSAEVEDLTDK